MWSVKSPSFVSSSMIDTSATTAPVMFLCSCALTIDDLFAHRVRFIKRCHDIPKFCCDGLYRTAPAQEDILQCFDKKNAIASVFLK